jgi:triosephosphate isomerase (TIM)
VNAAKNSTAEDVMTTPGIKPLVAGNWKMNGTISGLEELRTIGHAFTSGLESAADCLICPPATLISRAAEILANTPVKVGGQDCHAKDHGAHTGDISASMLKEAGATYVIVGHSERRTDHNEDDSTVRSKAEAALSIGLVAVICIGETLAERERGETLDVLSRQIDGSVPANSTSQTVVIAYEPVWAIGTALTPTAGNVAEAHAHIRERLQNKLFDTAKGMRILYGGSVKPGNAKELMFIGNVDGALVGGASLKAADFLGIAEAYRLD